MGWSLYSGVLLYSRERVLQGLVDVQSLIPPNCFFLAKRLSKIEWFTSAETGSVFARKYLVGGDGFYR
jgi:hypothetical protein